MLLLLRCQKQKGRSRLYFRLDETFGLPPLPCHTPPPPSLVKSQVKMLPSGEMSPLSDVLPPPGKCHPPFSDLSPPLHPAVHATAAAKHLGLQLRHQSFREIMTSSAAQRWWAHPFPIGRCQSEIFQEIFWSFVPSSFPVKTDTSTELSKQMLQRVLFS